MGNYTKIITAGGKTRYKAEAVSAGRRKSKRHSSIRAAKAWIRETETTMQEMRNSTGAGVTFGDAMRRFMDDECPRRKGGHAEANRLRKTMAMDIALVPLEQLDVSSATDHIDVLREHGLMNDSIIRDFTLLKKVVRNCLGWYSVPYPWRDLKMPKKGKVRNRLITDAEVAKFIDVSGYSPDSKPVTNRQIVCAMFLFGIETGMRQGEIAKLSYSLIDLDTMVVNLPDYLTKSNVDRVVPLSTEALRILSQFPMRSKRDALFGVTGGVCATTFGVIRNLCGVTDPATRYRFHDARHLACTRMARIPTMTAMKLARIMGHADVNQTMDYWNENMATIGQEMRDHSRAMAAGSDIAAGLAAMNLSIDAVAKYIDAQKSTA